ncbi:MAG: hypothetical protein LUH02_05195, partial [Erysipelotrichaceae bacterium]|nr:hypothetical protein [Erysipelotrichaceae bacterium]
MSKKLERISEQTEMKIKLISTYVEEWINVVENTNFGVDHILFVDCMCNRGLYEHNIKGTPIN